MSLLRVVYVFCVPATKFTRYFVDERPLFGHRIVLDASSAFSHKAHSLPGFLVNPHVTQTRFCSHFLCRYAREAINSDRRGPRRFFVVFEIVGWK